jgi:hypothetical protein
MKSALLELAKKLKNKTVKCSNNYCNICGRMPGEQEESNYAPLRYWEPDDGWTIATLCSWCWREVWQDKPKPTDFAYQKKNHVCDHENTDEDPSLAI